MSNEDNLKQNEDHGHRYRLRSRYINSGIYALLDYERLEMMLMYAIPRRDVKPIAKKLLAEFKSLSGIVDAPIAEVIKVSGMGEHSAIMFKMIKDCCEIYLSEHMEQVDLLSNPDRVTDYARLRIGSLEVEAMLIIYLNIKNMVISTDISYGTVDQALVYPRNLMKSALKHNATGLIMVHNHPSGFCHPSKADEAMTRTIQEAGRTMGVSLIDHVIVSKSTYYSFAASGKL